MKLLLSLLGSLTLLACAGDSDQTSGSAVNPVTHDYQRILFAEMKASAAERATCQAAGGIIRRAGKRQAERCIQTLADGGQACRDAADCVGRCVVDSPAARQIAPGTAATGTCEATDDYLGCTTLVNAGEIEGTLCID